MTPPQQQNQRIRPGQRWYDQHAEQTCVVLGRNYIGVYALQYEDGDIIEWGGSHGKSIEDRGMVYLPASREIEWKRPTLPRACDVDEHVFFTEPLTLHEANDVSLRCAKCGVEIEALWEDAEQVDVYDQVPLKCEACGDTIPPGVEAKPAVDDVWACESCCEKAQETGEIELLNGTIIEQ